MVSKEVLSGGGAVWTGVTAAVAIASALADTGAPVWIPVSRLSARSFGKRADAPTGLPLPAAKEVAGGSRFGLI
jgi:hypothetical protein